MTSADIWDLIIRNTVQLNYTRKDLQSSNTDAVYENGVDVCNSGVIGRKDTYILSKELITL